MLSAPAEEGPDRPEKELDKLLKGSRLAGGRGILLANGRISLSPGGLAAVSEELEVPGEAALEAIGVSVAEYSAGLVFVGAGTFSGMTLGAEEAMLCRDWAIRTCVGTR